jgi:hypothetical protein
VRPLARHLRISHASRAGRASSKAKLTLGPCYVVRYVYVVRAAGRARQLGSALTLPCSASFSLLPAMRASSFGRHV